MSTKKLFKEGSTVFFVAKDGKRVKHAKVVATSYTVVDQDGKRSTVDVDSCAGSLRELMRIVSAGLKERICLAYFEAVDKLAENFADVQAEAKTCPETIPLPFDSCSQEGGRR